MSALGGVLEGMRSSSFPPLRARNELWLYVQEPQQLPGSSGGFSASAVWVSGVVFSTASVAS